LFQQLGFGFGAGGFFGLFIGGGGGFRICGKFGLPKYSFSDNVVGGIFSLPPITDGFGLPPVYPL